MNGIRETEDVFSPNKLFYHMDRMAQWWRGENVYPINVELSPTTVCNHYCTWCMHGEYFGSHKGDNKALKLYPDASMMRFDFYRKLVDELAELGVKSMTFSGSGEPFVNPEINDFITYTKAKGIDVAIITNGSIINEERAKVVVKNVTWLRVSLNAGTAETRARIHRTSIEDFDKTLANMKRLAEKKKEFGSKTQLGGQIVICPENWEEVYLATEKVKATGFDYMQIKPVIMHPMSKDRQYEREFFLRAIELIRTTKELEDDRFKVFIKWDQFNGILDANYEQDRYEKCLATFFPVIEANKLVYYCSQTRGLPQFAIGDLSKNTFKEIWESAHRQRVIESIDIKKCQPLCRCHPINKTLWALKHPNNNPNFV